MGKKAMVSCVACCCPCRCNITVRCVVGVVACVLVAAALAVVVTLYLQVFRPHVMRVSADAADLGNFTLEPRTWILRYNLSLDIHVHRNPNKKRIAIQYEHLHAQALYQGQHIAHADIPGGVFLIIQNNNATLFRVVFFGQAPLQGGVAAAAFRREAGDNATFSIDVKLHARMKLKLWRLLTVPLPGPNPKIDCHLRIRRRKRATFELRPGSFSPTQCKVCF